MNVNSVKGFKSEETKEETSKDVTDESVDVTEIFRYPTKESATRPKTDQKILSDSETSFARFRIFLNHVDQFNGKYIAKCLSEEHLEEPIIQSKEEFLEGYEKGKLYSKNDLKNDSCEEQPPTKVFEGFVYEEGLTENNLKTESTLTVSEKHKFKIIGTMKDSKCEVPEGVSEIVQYSEDEIFLLKILSCGFIIYDITRDPQQIIEATWVLHSIQYYLDRLMENNLKTFKKLKEIRTFILISSMMTWAMTQPILPEEPELPFIEDDYRKRKPHPNYNEHIKLETEVISAGRKYKNQFKTLIITTGIPYGEEEDILNFLFRMAWENEPYLPVINSGTNLVPLIHVEDLSHILYGILKDFPVRSKFVFAMEYYVLTLNEIVKSISSELGTGRVKTITQEEALLYKDLNQDVFDLLNINFNAEPLYITEHIDYKGKHEPPFSEKIKQIVHEYKDARKLKPLNIFVHGPPTIGKTKISKKICEYYKLHYLDIDMVADEVIRHMRDHVERRFITEKHRSERRENGEHEKDDEKFEAMEGAVDLFQEIEENLERNQGKLDDYYKIKFLRERMLSNSCQNQGYVLDGYPTTAEEAKHLFEAAPEDEELNEVVEDEEYQEVLFNKAILPEIVISLNASDDYLTKQFIKNTIKCVEEKMDEEFLLKLEEFRRITSESNVISYFEPFDIPISTFPVSKDQNSYIQTTFDKIVKKIGKPRNYGLSFEEMLKISKQEEKARKIEEKLNREKINAEHLKKERERLKERENYAKLLNARKESEEESLAKKAIPLRHYLIKYVIPVVTRGIIEIADLKPEDPIDYLAEYIFKHNSEGKMYKSMVTEYSESDKTSLNASHLRRS